jgi:hypothetical protein
MRSVLAIDPGGNGGLAWRGRDGNVCAVAMPDTIADIASAIDNAKRDGVEGAVMERVGYHMPGNSGPATAKFARHCGVLEALLYSAQLPLLANPTPQAWMRKFALPREKQERKAKLKDIAQRRFTHLRVTLATSDALALLIWDDEREVAT